MNQLNEKYALALEKVIHFYSQLQLDSLKKITSIYAPDAQFKDPFQDVFGVSAIAQIYTKMFDNLENPRFEITQSIAQQNQAFLIWDFYFSWPSKYKRILSGLHKIHGATHFIFNEEGQVIQHRDYWDSNEELFEKIPVIRYFIKKLKAQV